jgi:hypothetical protein
VINEDDQPPHEQQPTGVVQQQHSIQLPNNQEFLKKQDKRIEIPRRCRDAILRRENSMAKKAGKTHALHALCGKILRCIVQPIQAAR